jgi:hypothetical protein
MKNIIKAFIAANFIMLSSSSMAAILDIDFNGNQFLLETFESAESGTDFYRYGNPSASSANPVYPGTTDLIPLQADALQIYTHINSITNELSFGIILEKPNGSGGGSFNTIVDFSLNGPVSTPAHAFVDDPGEAGNSPLGTTGTVTIDLDWINCCTDGFVISGFDPEDLFINLTEVSGSDLLDVIFLSPDKNNTGFDFPTNVFEISIKPCDLESDPQGCVIPPNPVPVPAAIWLFGTALIGLVGFSKRRKAA